MVCTVLERMYVCSYRLFGDASMSCTQEVICCRLPRRLLHSLTHSVRFSQLDLMQSFPTGPHRMTRATLQTRPLLLSRILGSQGEGRQG